ncbi:MAG: hypothetical protein GY762_09020 [Proteobacteria bacterium]|nr:hypothetical protein [Pseudomonadota bacterium]
MTLFRFLIFAIVLVFGLIAVQCTPTGVYTGKERGTKVPILSLRDPRLPEEARRWLADAEDEVAIAQSRVDDAEKVLTKQKAYGESLDERLKDAWATGKGRARKSGEKAREEFGRYAAARVVLAQAELRAVKKSLALARARLTQARAETAARYDVGIYDIEPIARKVEVLKNEVAEAWHEAEDQRAVVEKTADNVWKAFSAYVNKGGLTNALWETP